MRRSATRFGRIRAVGAAVLALGVLGGCAAASSRTVIRSADDVQVMTPAEVKAMRSDASTGDAAGTAGPGETVPQNVDDRPVEARIFEAFGKFRRCVEDAGDTIRGDLLDRSNPAFQDPEYVKLLGKCASRTGILDILKEFQSVRENLTPEQVKERNEGFKDLQPCLEKRGWTITTRTSKIGLIEAVKFFGPNGSIDERDVNQCAAEAGIDGDSWSK
ncbi:MAG: hypothetical protein ACKOBG_09570 [Actinomycetota bacterium]